MKLTAELGQYYTSIPPLPFVPSALREATSNTVSSTSSSTPSKDTSDPLSFHVHAQFVPRPFWWPPGIKNAPPPYADYIVAMIREEKKRKHRETHPESNTLDSTAESTSAKVPSKDHSSDEASRTHTQTSDSKAPGGDPEQEHVDETDRTTEEAKEPSVTMAEIEKADTKVTKLKWLLEHTMGCATTLELRRKAVRLHDIPLFSSNTILLLLLPGLCCYEKLYDIILILLSYLHSLPSASMFLPL